MGILDINRRQAQREAFCRGCDDKIEKGEEMISTYSIRNRGQNIYFCLKCAKDIGEKENNGNKATNT